MGQHPVDDALLIRLYADQRRAVDDLPYTLELEWIVGNYNQQRSTVKFTIITARRAYKRLQSLRKAGKLVRKRKGNKCQA